MAFGDAVNDLPWCSQLVAAPTVRKEVVGRSSFICDSGSMLFVGMSLLKVRVAENADHFLWQEKMVSDGGVR